MKLTITYLLGLFVLPFISCQANLGNVSNGSAISNFEFIDIHGTRHLLGDVKGKYRLLIFYDPEEMQSRKQMTDMKKSKSINKLIENGDLHVFAICPISDLNHWNTYKKNIPGRWINGFELKVRGSTKNYFDVSSFPTFFLIDENNEIIKRDTDYKNVISDFGS